MGEPNEVADQLGEVHLAGFWKPWAEVEKKAPTDQEYKDAQFIRVSAGFVGLGFVDGFDAMKNGVNYYNPRLRARERDENYLC
eukprot:g36844.t1